MPSKDMPSIPAEARWPVCREDSFRFHVNDHYPIGSGYLRMVLEVTVHTSRDGALQDIQLGWSKPLGVVSTHILPNR